MKKILFWLWCFLMLAGLVCGLVCGVQFVMALRFGELGRVVVYFLLAILSLELFAVGLTRLVRMRNSKDQTEQS